MNRDMPGDGLERERATSTSCERYNNARNSLRTLKSLADFMAGMRGRRKAVVLFQRGHQLQHRQSDSATARHRRPAAKCSDLVAAATRANVNIYSVDPRGVTSGMEDAIEISAFPPTARSASTNLHGRDAARAGQPARRRRRDRRLRGAEPERLPHGFSRILEDNSSYYVLGYYPTNDKRDGRFRNVQVKVLQARPEGPRARGYVAMLPGEREAGDQACRPRGHDAGAARRARQSDCRSAA